MPNLIEIRWVVPALTKACKWEDLASPLCVRCFHVVKLGI